MSRKAVEIFSDATERSLTSDQSGSVIFIDLTSNDVTLNLPPPEAGIFFEFVITNATNDFIIKSVNSSYTLTPIMHFGQHQDAIGNTLTITAPTISDRILLDCNGTNWYGSIICKTIGDYILT